MVPEGRLPHLDLPKSRILHQPLGTAEREVKTQREPLHLSRIVSTLPLCYVIKIEQFP